MSDKYRKTHPVSGLKTSCCTGGRCDLEQAFKAAHIVWALCVCVLVFYLALASWPSGGSWILILKSCSCQKKRLVGSENIQKGSRYSSATRNHWGQYGPLFKVEELLEETLLLLSWLVYKNRVFKTGFGVIGLGWC